MYRRIRVLHRWAGLCASLFLLVISATGLLLATKGSLGWIRPPEMKGTPTEELSGLISLDQAAQAVFELGLPELKAKDDIDRIDYRPKSNIFKIVSKAGYQEVQVDAKTGEVLSVAFRVDQLSEDIHDLSWFSDSLHTWVLPTVAVFLFFLGLSGIVIFFTPIARRIKNRAKLRNHKPAN